MAVSSTGQELIEMDVLGYKMGSSQSDLTNIQFKFLLFGYEEYYKRANQDDGQATQQGRPKRYEPKEKRLVKDMLRK